MSIAEEMSKDWNSQKTPPLSIQKQSAMAEEETSDRQHKFVANAFEDLGSALYDWCKGAVAGAEEVGRAASARGANLPAEYLDEYVSDKDKPELTNEQQQVEDWYQKAVNTFNDETTKPVMVAAALSGLPGLSQLGAMAMVPMMAEDLSHNVEKEGVVSGTATTVLNMAPIIGSYRQILDPNFQKFAEAHPGRATGLLLMNEAPWLAGAVQASKAIRMSELTEKFKGNIKKAREALRYEEQAVKPKPNPESVNAEVKADKKFSPKKAKTPQEEVNMSENPKVAEEIDKIMYDDALNKEAESIKANKVHRGAYDQDIEAIPPSDMSITSVTVPEIYATVNKILPFRIEAVLAKSKAVLGEYRPGKQFGSVRDTLNLETVAHEVGHYLDEKFKILGHDKELTEGAKSRWKNGEYAEAEYRGEGIAEFTTEYVLNPDAARQNFPGYYAEFVKKLAENPEIARDFETMCQQVRLWKTMEPAERVRGNMIFAGEVNKPMTQKALEVWDKIKASWVDEYEPFKKIIDDFVNRKAIALLQSENPAVRAAAVKNFAPARATALLGFFSNLDDAVAISALEKVYNIPLNKITLGTIYENLRVIQKDKAVMDYLANNKQYKNIHEAFSAYSAALHSLDVIGVKNAERVSLLTEKLNSFKEILQKSLDNEESLRKVLGELKDIDETTSPELFALKNQIEAKLADKKVSQKQDFLSTKIKELEQTVKDIEEGRNDYKTFADREALQAVIDNAPKQFADLTNNLSGVTENLMTLAVHFGFVSAKEAADIRKNYPHYVPLHRDFSLDHLVELGSGSKGKGKGFVNVDQPLYSLSKEGSTRTLIDPITELYKATHQLIEMGERNKIAQTLANLTKYDGSGELVVKVNGKPSAARGVFAVWEDGKQTYYKTIAPGLYDAITSSNAVAKGSLDVITNVLRKGASALRIGATSTPAFMAWNLIRDTVTASLYSKTGLVPIKGTLDGFFKKYDGDLKVFGKKVWSFKNDSKKLADQQLRADFLVQGVPFSTFIGSNKDITKMFLKRVKNKTKGDKLLDGLTKPLEFFENLNEATEQAPRLAEFSRMYNRMINEGYSVQEALFVAGQQARDLTVNFSQAGKYGKTVNKYTAFFNAAVQGNVKLAQAVAADVARTKKILKGIHEGTVHPKNAVERTISDLKSGKINLIEAMKRCPMGTTAWALTSITLPSIALWTINHDKDWYRDLPYREKMTNWFIEVADGVIIRLPKPELPGYVFGSIAERLMDKAVDQDPQAVLNSTMGTFLFDSVMTSAVPTAVLPILEWSTNWSFFRDRPVVDARYQKLEDEAQYNIYTSEMAKYAGQTFGKSPMKIDNAFRDVTGSLGSFFLKTTDELFKDNQMPERDWRDKTRFFYNPTPNSKNRTAEVFYDGLDKLSKKFNTEKHKGLKKNNQKPKELKGMERASRKLSDQYKIRGNIMEAKGKFAAMSPAERAEELKKVNYEINRIQNDANHKYLNYTYVPSRKK